VQLRKWALKSSIFNTFHGNAHLVRIISGKLKGRKLKTLKGTTTRPTLAKTRETIFNILQSRFELEAYEAFDLFAGSGALGFEAYSRGAARVQFLETDRQCYKVLKSNIQSLLLTDHCSISLKDATQWVKGGKWSGGPKKLFLLDPPYKSELAQKIIHTLGQVILMPAQSVIVLETEKDKQMDYPELFQLIKQKVIGKTRIDFIEIISQSGK
jgi:16S rRNA (guanine966-N2)-methyltransferase